LTFINHMKTGPKGSGDNGYIYSAPLHNTGILRGTVPAGVKEFSIKGSIPNPALFAVQYFTGYLDANDVIVEGVPFVTDAPVDYDNLKNIYVTSSPPLKDIVYIINKKSDNLYTEQVLRMIGVKEFSEGSFRSGIKAIRKCLGELNVSDEGLRLFDGSGLSRNNMITPQMMVKLLSSISGESYFDSFYNSLGIAGDPDDISSFRNFGANSIIAFNARIKSGTVNGVRGHSGYLKTRSGRLVSFSFIANNFAASSGKVNEAHIRWLQKIAETK
jgi:serine-type D-Ala-D-Ala carboxypeptidase/endopeptidase (penicillin-binding protein 4)